MTKAAATLITKDDQQVFNTFVDEELNKPLKYFRHECNTHKTDAVRDLCYYHGIAWYGMYWLLLELLATNTNHTYKVECEKDWIQLFRDINANSSLDNEITIDEIKAFIEALAQYGLIEKDFYIERGRIKCELISTTAVESANTTAKARFGAYKSHASRKAKKHE